MFSWDILVVIMKRDVQKIKIAEKSRGGRFSIGL